jgi:hypothetical protein
MSAHTSVGKHTPSIGNNGSVHMLSHTILLRNVWDGVVPDDAFIAGVIIKFI